MKSFWIILALLSGAFLPIQAGFNTRLGRAIESPVYAAFISFVVGMAVVAIYLMISRQHVSFAGAPSAPAYAWLGGLLGAFYVTAIILAFPQIGPALTFGLVITGQMIISVLMDHFNVLVTQPHPINAWRIAGVALVIAGVIIIRKF